MTTAPRVASSMKTAAERLRGSKPPVTRARATRKTGLAATSGERDEEPRYLPRT
jgi:hypothetical protein